MAVEARINRSRARARLTIAPVLERWREWPAEAWGAIAVTALFLGLTCWWVAWNRSVPIADAGFHLAVTIEVFQDLQGGNWRHALGPHVQYPPFLYLVGTLGILIGGLNIPSMILAENLFYVPLLALGCYGVGRLAFGPRAGLLAVVFALGSPLVARLFHLMLLDAPQAAMAAVSVWLILATRYFSRLWICAPAGLAVGIGMVTKQSVLLFVVGVLAVTLLRGGWRNWRGLLVFAAFVVVIAGPWYWSDFAQVQDIGSGVATAGTTTENPIAPPRLSSDNLQWYTWSFVTLQVFLPLFLFSAVGTVWTFVGFLRRRWVSPFAPELFVGAFAAWLGLTETFVHDNRYGMSMLIYLAVFGSFWIVRLPRRGRIAATTALVLVAIVNTLGSNFGVGGRWLVQLPEPLKRAQTQPNFLTIYSNEGYLVAAAPEHDGNMLATLNALKRVGVTTLVLLSSEAPNEGAFLEGMLPLAMLTNLHLLIEATKTTGLDKTVAVLDRESTAKTRVPPCVKLPDGTGVWIRLGDPYARGAMNYCPSHNPQFYLH